MTPRLLTPEILDGLPSDDPAAIRSRRDLQRVHRAMGTRHMIVSTVRAARSLGPRPSILRILEVGAGDGRLMLAVAKDLHRLWPSVELELLDRLDLVQPATLSDYEALGWTAHSRVANVFDWVADDSESGLPRNASHRWDLVIANLFLHHFEGAPLRALLRAIETRSDCFLAYEPRRSWLATMGSHLIGILGANAVTRTDAVLSVQAGFRGAELSTLWPAVPGRWTLQEQAAGLFSHCFFAERNPPPVAT